MAAHSASINAGQHHTAHPAVPPVPQSPGGDADLDELSEMSQRPAASVRDLPVKRSLAPALEAESALSQQPEACAGAADSLAGGESSVSPADKFAAIAQGLRERRDSHKRASTQVSAGLTCSPLAACRC